MAEKQQLKVVAVVKSEDLSDSGDSMCEYEKRRLKNIRENHTLLRSLGKH